MGNHKAGEANYLSKVDMALTNCESEEEIASILVGYTYDSTKIAEGKDLLAKTVEIWKYNRVENDEQSMAHSKFIDLYSKLDKSYSGLRKRSKVVFRKDSETLKRLNLNGSKPHSYAKFLISCEKLYEEINKDNELLSKLALMKVDQDVINEGLGLITDVKDARYNYHREKSESQQATQDKDHAMIILEDWMDDFYGVVKIALEDKPQLLEALGIRVRS